MVFKNAARKRSNSQMKNSKNGNDGIEKLQNDFILSLFSLENPNSKYLRLLIKRVNQANKKKQKIFSTCSLTCN